MDRATFGLLSKELLFIVEYTFLLTAAQEDEIESDDGGDLWCYCRDIEHG